MIIPPASIVTVPLVTGIVCAPPAIGVPLILSMVRPSPSMSESPVSGARTTESSSSTE